MILNISLTTNLLESFKLQILKHFSLYREIKMLQCHKTPLIFLIVLWNNLEPKSKLIKKVNKSTLVKKFGINKSQVLTYS